MNETPRKTSFSLPYPSGLSVNRYLVRATRQIYLNPKVKQYYREVYWLIHTYKIPSFEDRDIEVSIEIYPPTRRRMDVDNCLKVVLDALQNCGMYNNDNQIRKLTIERREVVDNSRLDIEIKGLQYGSEVNNSQN